MIWLVQLQKYAFYRNEIESVFLFFENKGFEGFLDAL